MSNTPIGAGEGGLKRPERLPINWKSDDYYNQDSLMKELERVYDICHGCRRCFNLCKAFPILFDAIDKGDTGELESVDKKTFWDVVNNCYMCDMCYMTKCPYVPPHPFNLDFPALMLRAKAIKFKKGSVKLRDKLMSNTDFLGKINSLPIISWKFNLLNKIKPFRWLQDKLFGIHKDANVPKYHFNTLRRRFKNNAPSGTSNYKVMLFVTCYGNYNEPDYIDDLIRVYEHNNIEVNLLDNEKCCGMPKLEMGDIESVIEHMNHNVRQLSKAVNENYDIVIPMPSCAFIIKEIWHLLAPNDHQIRKIKENTYDPFEYLMKLHKDNKLKTDFKNPLGKVAYHVPCHLRAQNIGTKTKDVLSLIPDTTVTAVERCSGHDGTYAIKSEYHETAKKICQPLSDQMMKLDSNTCSSDCIMAGKHIEDTMGHEKYFLHPISLLRRSYNI